MDNSFQKKAFCHELPWEEGRLVWESASGVHVTDSKGRAYLDAISGVFVVSFGYGCRPILEAVQSQLVRLPFAPPLHGLNAPAMELCESLAELAGPPYDCVKLVNGGSESIEAALRLTRLYQRAQGKPGKTKILSHYNGYHGVTYGAMSATHRHDLDVFGPRLPGFLGIWAPDPHSAPHAGHPETCASVIEQLIEVEGPDSVGAVIVEPVIHLLGMLNPPPSYFARLRQICDRHGLLLIFDEVVTGFGRTGAAFAAHALGVKPDILCMGKSVSGGYAPLAAVVMSEKVSTILRDPKTRRASFAPSHTYAGNPVSAAAGLAATRLLRDPCTAARIEKASERIELLLRAVAGERGEVRGRGMLWGIKFKPFDGMSQGHLAALRMGKAVMQSCLERGVIVRGEGDWLAIAPAYTTTDAELEIIGAAIGESIDEFVRTLSRGG